MIHKLSGIYETVDFREDEQICLYYNDEYENYPPHWHTSFEILLPIVNGYRALCGGKDYNLREGDILIIGPCMIHELFAPEKGEDTRNKIAEILRKKGIRLNRSEMEDLVDEIAAEVKE